MKCLLIYDCGIECRKKIHIKCLEEAMKQTKCFNSQEYTTPDSSDVEGN